MSHALRHEPWIYELELDGEGWVPVESLLSALQSRGWRGVDEGSLGEMIEASSKRRHEMVAGRIRALYGHSLPGRLQRTEAPPPDLLFHGTTLRAWQAIRDDGLRPMGRQYVHLSADVDMATRVGRRKEASPQILVVRAGDAHASGTQFWIGNELVWLAAKVPPEFISSSSEVSPT